jgi:hypothetical protein
MVVRLFACTHIFRSAVTPDLCLACGNLLVETKPPRNYFSFSSMVIYIELFKSIQQTFYYYTVEKTFAKSTGNPYKPEVQGKYIYGINVL